MSKLSDYIESSRKDHAGLARLWGVTPRAVRSYLYGERQPSVKTGLKIVKTSRGKLTLDDLYK